MYGKVETNRDKTNYIALFLFFEARAGFEPANEGFADLAIGPLWYRATIEGNPSRKFIVTCATI